jgi:multiple sugar transport system substrate-binding protein
MVGINYHSKNKKAAFDYIKLLLSEKMQESSNLHLVPVNKSAFMADKKGKSNEYNALAIKLSKNIGKCEISENKIYGIIINELNDFLNNKKTAEQTAATIQDKVNIYLYE